MTCSRDAIFIAMLLYVCTVSVGRIANLEIWGTSRARYTYRGKLHTIECRPDEL